MNKRYRMPYRGIPISALCISAAVLSACGGSSSSPTTPVAPAAPNAQSLCAAFTNKTYATAEGTATVTNAQLIAAAGGDPEHCRVQGSIPPSLHFEVKLPTTWNQRLLYIGGGGFDGVISQPPGYQFSQGYVTVASDGGHPLEAGTELWALDPEKLNDFAYRSVHKTLLAARAIVQERYAQTPVRSYFEGCSNGGREALIQAQRYPNDFDGIVARAPASNFTWLMMAGNKRTQTFFASNASQLSTAKITTLNNAVLAACDLLDNVDDGIISNPLRCNLNPTTLRCPTGTDTNACLTDAQIATVNSIYFNGVNATFRLNNGTAYYIGWPAGGESDPGGWPFWVASINDGLPSFSTRFIQYFLEQNPAGFVLDNNLPIVMNRSALIDAESTDYAAFRARNGKLLLWHGTNDWAISYNNTAMYYNRVVTAAGSQAVADQFVEFFPAPGVQHCFGGSGPDFVDLLTPVRNWVEGGVPPSQQNLNIVKLNLQNLTITNSRPLCKFPLYPRYTGSGDRNLFTSYTCAVP